MITELEVANPQVIKDKTKIIGKLFTGKKVLVAYSGGVDSSVVALFAKTYAKNTKLVMQIGSSVAQGEDEIAIRQANYLGLDVKFIEYDEVDFSPEYTNNPENRCYYCKELLHSKLEEIREQLSYDMVVSGTNISDLSGHRPGYAAQQKAGVVNPLVDAKLSKHEVRWIANQHGLEVWDKPAMACLASRFVTGVMITKEDLKKIDQAEYYIRSNYKIPIVRVRYHGNGMVRIEVSKKDLPKLLIPSVFDAISKKFQEIGFQYITIDMQGYRPAKPHQQGDRNS